MFVRKDKKIIWTRVPKTGSSAIMNAMRPWDNEPNRSHIMFSEISDIFVEKHYDWIWAGSIRHPFTWLPSLRACLRVKNHPAMLEEYFFKDGIVPDDWRSFVAELRLTPIDWLEDARIKPLIFKQEEVGDFEKYFNVKTEWMNESALENKLSIDIQDDKLATLIEDRFSRELTHYEGRLKWQPM